MPKLKVSTEFGGKQTITGLFKRMGIGADEYGRRSSRAFKKSSKAANQFKSITKGILGAQLITSGVAKLQQGVGAATDSFLDFDDVITQAAVKFKDIGPRAENFKEKLEELKEVSRKYGEETIFTGTQVASAFKTMAQGGFKYATAVKAIGGQIDFALATGEDFVESTRISSKLLGGFGLAVKDPIQKTKNLAFVNDILAKTVNSSSINLENFFDAAKDIGPIARNLGSDLPEVASFIGVLGNSSIDATKAMTGLRNMFLRMSSPTAKAASVLKGLKLSLFDDSGKAKNMTKFLGELADKTKGFSEEKKAFIFKALFEKVGVASAFILTDEIHTGVKDFRKEIDGAGGEVAAMSVIMQNTILNKIKKLVSALTELSFKFIDTFKGKGADLVVKLTAVIQKFDITPIRRFFGFMKKLAGRTGLVGLFTDGFRDAGPIIETALSAAKFTLEAMADAVGEITKGLRFILMIKTPEEKRRDAIERRKDTPRNRLKNDIAGVWNFFADYLQTVEDKEKLRANLNPPNQNQANNINVRFGVETNINAPEGTTSETKVKRLPNINSDTGSNGVLAIQ